MNGQWQSENVMPKQCHNCGTIKTSSWRRDAIRKVLLCNACGLHLKIYGTNRILTREQFKESEQRKRAVTLSSSSSSSSSASPSNQNPFARTRVEYFPPRVVAPNPVHLNHPQLYQPSQLSRQPLPFYSSPAASIRLPPLNLSPSSSTQPVKSPLPSLPFHRTSPPSVPQTPADLPNKWCTNCGVTSTTCWRRDPSRVYLLCNPCGLHLKIHRVHRHATSEDRERVLLYESMSKNGKGTRNRTGLSWFRRDLEQRKENDSFQSGLNSSNCSKSSGSFPFCPK